MILRYMMLQTQKMSGHMMLQKLFRCMMLDSEEMCRYMTLDQRKSHCQNAQPKLGRKTALLKQKNHLMSKTVAEIQDHSTKRNWKSTISDHGERLFAVAIELIMF